MVGLKWQHLWERTFPTWWDWASCFYYIMKQAMNPTWEPHHWDLAMARHGAANPHRARLQRKSSTTCSTNLVPHPLEVRPQNPAWEGHIHTAAPKLWAPSMPHWELVPSPTAPASYRWVREGGAGEKLSSAEGCSGRETEKESYAAGPHQSHTQGGVS